MAEKKETKTLSFDQPVLPSILPEDVGKMVLISAGAKYYKELNWLPKELSSYMLFTPYWVNVQDRAHYKNCCPQEDGWLYLRIYSVKTGYQWALIPASKLMACAENDVAWEFAAKPIFLPEEKWFGMMQERSPPHEFANWVPEWEEIFEKVDPMCPTIPAMHPGEKITALNEIGQFIE
jgi:hypothetical protein